MAQCIITGCDLIDMTQDRWCHGDLFEDAGLYVFNACLKDGETAWNYSSDGLGEKLITVCGEFFERRAVIAFPHSCGQLSEEAIKYIEGRD